MLPLHWMRSPLQVERDAASAPEVVAVLSDALVAAFVDAGRLSGALLAQCATSALLFSKVHCFSAFNMYCTEMASSRPDIYIA
jgi:hypothetical protein